MSSGAQRQWEIKLLNAAAAGNVSVITKCLAKGYPILESKDRTGNTPLLRATFQNQTLAVALLLEHGAEVKARNYDYDSPLHIAARNGFIDIADLLLKAGAPTEVANAARHGAMRSERAE